MKCFVLQTRNPLYILVINYKWKMTIDKIKDLDGIELLPHSPYSPKLAPYDYYLFGSIVYFHWGRQFKNVEDVRTIIQAFIDSKPKDYMIYPNKPYGTNLWRTITDCVFVMVIVIIINLLLLWLCYCYYYDYCYYY